MGTCKSCGVNFHPELTACPVCGEVPRGERIRRRRFGFLLNSAAATIVATFLLVNTLSAEARVGMRPADCQLSREMAQQTRNALRAYENKDEDGSAQLLEVSAEWARLASGYTPGKYSWSATGLEHNWLDRLSKATRELATGGAVSAEGMADSSQYVRELTFLLPRYCS